jgi:hypothetical protein
MSVDGEFAPVEPNTPTGSQWGGDPAEPPTDINPGGEDIGSDPAGAPGGGGDDMDTDLLAPCLPFTTRQVNIALSRIGVSKQIALLATEIGQEAIVARLHYAEALKATLRDFPWPFATRYADLVLLAGSVATPVNRDWTYAYRQPSDCVFERRLVVTRDGAVNSTPPPFQLSYDNALQINRILTNEPSARLEYTARPECSAGRGDPLFRDAFQWKLASMFAAPLSRMPDVVKHANDQYEAAIQKAIQVLRPGNPGPRRALDNQDVATGCGAANVAVVNLALVRIGAQTIANLDTEQSREGEAARVIFETELRATLRDFPWPFATKYETALVLVAGTTAVPANQDWTYAYRYPADAVFVRRIATPSAQSSSYIGPRAQPVQGRGFDPNPAQYRVGNDLVGNLLYTNELTPTIEYTARIPCAVSRGDDLFRDALAWRLAASLAPSLAQVDPAAIEQAGRGPQDRPRERKATEAQLRARAAESAWRMYYGVLAKAKSTAANESQKPPDGDAPWITGRDTGGGGW